MFQKYVSGKYMLLLVHYRMSPCRRGSPHHAPASGGHAAAACMWACETERARGGPRTCVGRTACGARWVRQARVRKHRPMLAPRIGHPSTSKSLLFNLTTTAHSILQPMHALTWVVKLQFFLLPSS
jgi:hypothetical protein